MGTQFQSYIKERGDGDLSRMMASEVVVQLMRCFWFFDTRWMAAHQASLSFISPRVCSDTCPLSWWCHPTTSSSLAPLLLPSIFPSIRVFTNESALHIRWPKYWSFSISPSNEYLGLISFRIDWFDLLAVQGTLKSFLQHHSSKASILQHSASFMVQLSHPHMTTGKTRALTRRTFAGKVISLAFNTLSWS